jgi:hypothetical protein
VKDDSFINRAGHPDNTLLNIYLYDFDDAQRLLSSTFERARRQSAVAGGADAADSRRSSAT